MSFSDSRFAYGPFAPHWVPRQYIENYFSLHKTDGLLVLNTTVEDVTRIPAPDRPEQWRLTLRKFDCARNVDIWWQEVFDAVVFANGHYSVPYVSLLGVLPMSKLSLVLLTDASSYLMSRASTSTSKGFPDVWFTPRPIAPLNHTPVKRFSSSATRPRATM